MKNAEAKVGKMLETMGQSKQKICRDVTIELILCVVKKYLNQKMVQKNVLTNIVTTQDLLHQSSHLWEVQHLRRKKVVKKTDLMNVLKTVIEMLLINKM